MKSNCHHLAMVVGISLYRLINPVMCRIWINSWHMCMSHIKEITLQSFYLSLKPLLKEEMFFTGLGIILSCRSTLKRNASWLWSTEHQLCCEAKWNISVQTKVRTKCTSHIDYSKAPIGDQLHTSSDSGLKAIFNLFDTITSWPQIIYI